MGSESANPSGNHDVPWSQWLAGAVIATVVLTGLEIMVYRSLAPLERGDPQTLAVWEPIAIVYELCGFTAALSIIPALWLLLMGIVAWQTWLRLRFSRHAP